MDQKKPIIVKAQPGHGRCAEHVANFFRKLGHDVKVTSEAAIEIPIEIAFAGEGAGGDR